MYNIYNYETNDQYGTPENIASFINIAVAYKMETGGLMNYGDLSNAQGNNFSPHATHANGSQVDFRYMVGNVSGSATPVNYTHSEQNLQNIQTFINIAYEHGMRNFWLSSGLSGHIRHPETDEIITKPAKSSKTTVNGVTFGFSGHEDHGHTGK